MLGISVYFKDLDLDYIKKANELGAKYIFTSLHIPEEDYSDIQNKMLQLLEYIKSYEMQLVPDVSPITFKVLNICEGDYSSLKKMGIKALRLDYGFDDFNILKELQKDFRLMLNASTINDSYLCEAKKSGIDLKNISLTHNFYPHKETGLDIKKFQKKNKDLKKYSCKIQAFVCGDDLKRFPLYEGLPTLEKHRGINPYIAAVELLQTCYVDDIFIGDSKAKIDTLFYISDYIKNKNMHIKCNFEKNYEFLYNQHINIRKDIPENVVRLGVSRQLNIPIYHTTKRFQGSICMENKLAGRYSGEIMIVKKTLEAEARSNVIGYIHPEYIDLLEYVDENTTIIFDRV